MKNFVGRDIPDCLLTGGREVYQGKNAKDGVYFTKAGPRVRRCEKPVETKVVPTLKEALLRCGAHDGMTVSFHHHLRDGDYVVGAARAKYDHQVLMVTERGYGKRTPMDEYFRADGPQKRGGYGLKGYQVTEKTGPVVGVKVVSDEDDILVINDAGVIIRMAVKDINVYSRSAQGVKLMNLDEGVKVISIARTDHEEEETGEGASAPETTEG